MSIVVWTPERDERLKVLALNHTHRQIGVILGHTQGAIASRCELLGIKRKSGRAPKFVWTPELDEVVAKADEAELLRIAPLLNQRVADLYKRQRFLKHGPEVVKVKPSAPASVFQWGQP